MEKEVIQWHPAFCSAMELELIENEEGLQFNREHNLNRKPLQIDLLVIKKSEDVYINNEIGKMFREHNIMEYKSPGDDVNVDTWFKVLAYACLYKAGGEHVDEIKAEDITISLVREEKPEKLINWLEENGYTITSTGNGIYCVHRDHFFETQIIVSSELSVQEHVWLAILTRNLRQSCANELLHRIPLFSGKKEQELVDAVLNVVISANQKTFEDSVKEESDMSEALLKLLEPKIIEIKEKAEKAEEAEEARKKAEEAQKRAEEVAQLKEQENQRLKEKLKELQAKLAMF